MTQRIQKSRAAVAAEKLRQRDIPARTVLNEVQVKLWGRDVYSLKELCRQRERVLAIIGPKFRLVAQGKGHFGNPAMFLYFRHDKDPSQRRAA